MKLKITVDGKVYEVEVEVPEPEPAQPSYLPPAAGQTRVPAAPSMAPPRPTAGAATPVADESKVCRSPISGVVVRVSAQVGQTIQPNDVLLVLEAMKMETVITSPIAGKVAKVNAAAGDAVQAGQVLVEFE
ncbi:MAG: biotin/lipoyl-containing protein [Gemmataceae bacterium]